MILEYFSLGKGPFTELYERLEKFLLFYFRIITSYLKMSGIPCHKLTIKFTIKMSGMPCHKLTIKFTIKMSGMPCHKLTIKFTIKI